LIIMFHITSYLLILLGILALPLIEGKHFVSFLSFALFTFGYIFAQPYSKFQLSKEMRNALLISAFTLGPVTLFILGRFGEWEIIWLSWYLLFLIQITGIFGSKNNRGWILSYLISSLQIAIAGIFTGRILFLILFLFYLILTVFNFILLLPRIEIKEKFLKLLKSKADFTKWGVVTTTNVFLITALIFFILPRTKSPLFEIKKGMHLADKLKGETTGEVIKGNFELKFPERPSLGSFSDVKQKDILIMIVETTKPFLWRVKSFNSYKDGGWFSVGSRPVRIKIKNRKVNLKPIYLRKELFAQIKPGQFYYQKFYIKNYAQNLLIGAYPVIEIDDVPGTNISIDHFENIYLEKKIGMGSRYEVVSIDKKYSPDYLRSLPRKYPQEITNLYLRLPFDLDKNILNLTDKILKNSPSNIYDEVVLLREYLKRNCRYGLINKSNRPTLSEFLFGKKEGDCEYFATALALMLRYRNIPTRFVIGFSGGEFDYQKRTSMVYARNAHAWIEIFFPTIGWLPCDVVPGRAYRRQWSDIPSVVVLKPKEVFFEEQPGVEGMSDEGEELVKEGVPENELLPDEYLFREELAAGKAVQKEVVLGKEFFEKEAISGREEQVSEEVSTEEAAAGGEEQVSEEVSTEEAAAGGEEQVSEEVSTEEAAAGGEEQVSEEVSTEEAATGGEEQVSEEVSEEAAAGGEEQVAEEGFLEEEVPLEEQIVSAAEESSVEVLDEVFSEEVISSEEQETPSGTENVVLEEERKEIKPIPDLDIVKENEIIPDEDVISEEDISGEEELPEESEVSEKNKLLTEISYEHIQESGQEAVEEKPLEKKQVTEDVLDEKSVFDETAQKQMDMKKSILDKFSKLKWLKEKLERWILKFSYYTQKMIVGFLKNIVVQMAVFIKKILSGVVLHVKSHRTPYVILSGILILLALCRHVISKIIRKRAEKAKITRLFPPRQLTQEEKVITNFYLYALHLLEKIGYERHPYLTPREFAQQLLAKGFKISKGFLYLTDMFYKISFGHMKVEPVELQKIHKITAEIKVWTKEMKY